MGGQGAVEGWRCKNLMPEYSGWRLWGLYIGMGGQGAVEGWRCNRVVGKGWGF